MSDACKNCFSLLLKYLTEKNSFRGEGSWFHILPALYIVSQKNDTDDNSCKT